jgi:hypothetical protein
MDPFATKSGVSEGVNSGPVGKGMVICAYETSLRGVCEAEALQFTIVKLTYHE